MDNNPWRRASESSEDEELFVLAPETCDDHSDDDDTWFDMLEDFQNVSGELSYDTEQDRPHIDKEPEKSTNQKPSQESQLNQVSSQQNSEQSTQLGNKRNVLETDVDSGQQRFIMQGEHLRYEHTQHLASDEIYVTFHALVSSDINFQAETDRVILYIWDGLYKEDKGTFIGMEFVRNRQDAKNAAEISQTVSLKKSNSFLSQLRFRYLIERNSIDPVTGKSQTHFWEQVYTDSRHQARLLNFTNLKNLEGKQFHQYDGFIYQPIQKGMWETFKEAISFSNRDADAELVSRIFAQDITKILLRYVPTSEDILQAKTRSLCLRLCIEHTYNIHNNMVKKVLWDVYSNVLKILMHFNDDSSVQRKVAMCLLMLHFRHLAPVASTDTSIDLLCKSFLLKEDLKFKTTKEWTYIENYISTQDRESLKNGLKLLALDVAKSSSKGKNPSWFYLLPMLHFLDGTCKPYQEITLDTSHRGSQPIWWGISPELESVIRSFKNAGVQWTTSLRQVSENIRYMFEVDFYLPRTILASLSLGELKDALDTCVFPPEICCACITYFILTHRRDHNQIEKCIESLLLHIESASLGGLDQRRAEIGVYLSSDLLDAVVFSYNKRNCVLYSLRIFLWFVTRCDTIDEETDICTIALPTDHLQRKFEKIYMWLEAFEKKANPNMKALLQLWDTFLLPIGIPNTRGVKQWTDLVMQALENKIRSCLQGHHGGLVEAYCSQMETYSALLQEILSSYILMSLTEKTSTQSTKDITVYKKLWSKMSKKFVEKYKEISKTHNGMGIETVLAWTGLPMFMIVLYQRCNSGELEKACCDYIQDVKYIVEYCLVALNQGTVYVRELKMLLQHKEQLMMLAQILGQDISQAEKALTCRADQLKAFLKKKSTLETLKLFCKDTTGVLVQTEPVDAILNRDVEQSMLNQLIVVKDVDIVDEHYAGNVEIHDSKLSKQVTDMVSRLDLLKESACFTKLWNDAFKDISSESIISLDDVYEKVFKPSWQRIQDIERQISSGDISFRDMEEFIGRTFEEKYDKMLSELKLFCCRTEETVLRERLTQLERCRQVVVVSKIASVLLQVQEVYNLSGDFSAIYNMIHNNVDDLALTTDTEEILKASQEVHNLTKSKLKCLEAFVRSEELVTWLRNIMKGGVKEVKVFVDLAMSSAGDNIDNISRVQSLHAAINGFSTLIFGLKQEFGFQDFLKACECVWEELKNTPKLSDKLIHAHQFLYWFKEIKRAHGAVEVTSFMQAVKINECGIYKIGTRVWKAGQEHIVHSFADPLDMKQVLKLMVIDEEGYEIPREYTFDELHDLQSRLMLVAGEAERSKQSVERFNSVLDGVIRLSSVYIKLVKSGCMLFNDFAIQLYCDPSSDLPVVAILEFENKGSYLQCRKTETEQLEDVMYKIATELEKCYESWLKHVDQNRTDFPELNYFTTEQLVILQQEIALLAEKEGSPSKLIYPMFHTILHDCLPDDLLKAWESVSLETTSNSDDPNKQKIREEKDEANETKEEVFVRELIESGYERLVPLAIEKFPTFEIDDALMWCFENLNDVETLEEMQFVNNENVDAENGVDEKTVSIESLISKALDNKSQFDRCDAMLLKLTEIWNSVLDSNSTQIRGFINLNHLGKLLRDMSRKDGRIFNRSLPKGYSDTAPNLVVCNDGEIWNQTLSLYLCDEAQPLPQDDEVLTCSEETTLEHVDIFLRRAFFNSNGKLHCLVNPDRMSFTICEAIEQRLLKYQRMTAEPATYRLVFICGFKSENRSVIVSALDKHRRTTFLLDSEVLCSSLSNRLKVDENDSDQRVKAASVDFQRSTVRVVRSTRSGVGKSLYVKRRVEELQEMTKSDKALSVSLPLHTRNVDFNYITRHLIPYVEETESQHARIFHIDITSEVLDGIDYLLFNLLILGSLSDKSGYVWRKLNTDLYLVETLEKNDTGSEKEVEVLKLLPFVSCRSPDECLNIYNGENPIDFSNSDQLFDTFLFNMELYQTPYACLREIDGTYEISERHCIETLLRHCGISNPSWSEIYHFVKFLNTQLMDFQKTDFVSDAVVGELPGFPLFVQRFLIQMSRDFSSRSLNISEETYVSTQDDQDDELHNYQIKRTWEKSPHPYLFFNADGQTFTFLGFYINDRGDLVDIQNNTTLERSIMSRYLLRALMQNGVPIKEDFDSLPRNDKIARLCKVMGVPEYDEDVYDSTYELTTDNCKKMLAVYMRLRCDIPVIVMGETGCGKTRLIKFLCELMVPRDADTKQPLATNMVIVKVHGGVSNADIMTKVRNAEKIAIENMKKYNKDMYTVLFFDEANTTESIGLLKEIMCDKTMEGAPLNMCENLKFILACNPYRRHPEEVIAKLEKAGLGYHVKAKKTKDRFGRIPMRRLVYRVQPLPQSLLPFVWDFGQLDSVVENLYIRHMVRRYMVTGNENGSHRQLPNDEQLLDVISSILTESQAYMRNLKDECSFVSLRDVERVLQVMCWFYKRSKGQRTLFRLADKKLKERGREQTLNDETRSLILALGVCYHASLTKREAYRTRISQFFRSPCELTEGPDQIFDEIDRAQEVFLDCIHLDDDSNIAKNQALKENVFMMVVCIELRIPLFLVGKPGSSKSLAKVIVTDAMQGRAAKNDVFKELKQVQMVSFQCSPLSTTGGIISTFHQCANFQENYKDNLEHFVSVVVLDEIGLAEDSDRMPLKTLHPLLEDGCQGDEIPEDYKKVAFIGISNWSLDPAKMNRGIFLQREVPDSVELQNTARGICLPTKEVNNKFIKPLATAYLKVFKKASEEIREFFGLRDFYSLMKMVNHIVQNSADSHRLTYRMLRFAVRRNFSGLESIDTFGIFQREVTGLEYTEKPLPGDPDDSFPGLIDSWINNATSESRHLLLLTENDSALQLFQQAFLRKTSIKPVIIYGSSFRRDQEYTKICRNINKIKICMETGKLVILVNSDNLYESLYDALNQYYVYFGGERYVDLGLGTHRVKCPVHRDFKLIVVAEKQTVYENFPIPLINRLEKQCLNSNTLLSEQQKYLANLLKEWVEEITKSSLLLREQPTEADAAKVFIGYHHDACSTIAVENWKEEVSPENSDQWQEALKRSRDILIWCAAPDAISRLKVDREKIQDIYWNEQAHESLKDYLSFQFENRKSIYSQVTTHSSLLTSAHKQTLWEATKIHPNRILLLEALPSFDTEQQFIGRIKECVQFSSKGPALLVIQCDSGDKHSNLIACAKHALLDECTKLMNSSSISILFIVQLTPMENKCFHSIQCGEWHSAHIDNLYTPVVEMPRIQDMQKQRMSVLIAKAIEITQFSQEVTGEQDIQHEKRLDLRKLIERSLQRAVSLVKDPEEYKVRSTKRVTLILSILHEKAREDCDLFVRGIGFLLERIIAHQENELPLFSGENWFQKEASSVLAIQKFGTFRRACLNAFDLRISPILGGIFAMLDTNHNLDILECGSGSWQRDLWINLINTKEVSQKVLNDVHTERGIEYNVHGTGCGDRNFQCKMPFSWIIHNAFEAILRQHTLHLENISVTDRGQYFISILKETEFISAIETIAETYFYDVLGCYIHDFVNTVYTEEKDRELVALMIKQSTLDRVSLDERPCLPNALMYVHQVYQDASTGLKYFRDLSNVWVDCTRTLMEEIDTCIGNDNNLALCALLKLIDSVSSVNETTFNSEDGRNTWLSKVHRYRQVVNQTFAFYQDTMMSSQMLSEARYNWNRVVVMQLFCEFLFVDADDKLPVKRLTLLWKMLSKNKQLDLKNLEPLEKIEEILRICFKKFSKDLKRDVKKCARCGSILLNESTVLQCDHEICRKCVAVIQQDKSHACPVCKRAIKDYLVRKGINSFAAEKIRCYRQRCNFVFMEIVSQMCFADNTPPTQDVIDWLMSYSFKRQVKEDQELALHESEDDVGVDSNKIFKIFIFKHLVRTNKQEFQKRLEKFFETVVDDKQLDDMFLPIIYTIEECFDEAVDVKEVKKWLESAQASLENADSIVVQIYGVAKVRKALSMCAQYVNKLIGGAESNIEEMEEALIMAKQLCDRRIHLWKYLMRFISQEFGSDVLLSACKSTMNSISWVKTDEEVACTIDMYTACGECYSEMKSLVFKAMLEKDNNSLFSYIKDSREKQQTAVMLELVIHREKELQACLNQIQINNEEMMMIDEAMELFDSNYDKLSNLAVRDLRMLHLNVTAVEDTDRTINIKCLLFHWFCVIKHVFSETKSSELLHPLFQLALKPSSFKDVFLPAMPQDELADIRQTLLNEAESVYLEENTMYYRCENGHSYEIGQCGRPWVKAKCICGAEIGGVRHKLHDKNIQDDGSDRTKKGHCLGVPQNRLPGAVPERSLTPTQCAVIKWLLHMTLYLGCSFGVKDICYMIHEEIDEDNVHQFLWDHILLDLEDLQSNLSLSVDEVLLFSHCFIDMIMKTEKHYDGESLEHLAECNLENEAALDEDNVDETAEDEENVNTVDLETFEGTEYPSDSPFNIPVPIDEDENGTDEDEDGTRLRLDSDERTRDSDVEDISDTENEMITQNDELLWHSKHGRKQWEIAFTTKYINPFIKEKDTIICAAKQQLQDSSTMFTMLSESTTLNEELDPTEVSLLQNKPDLWVYRKPVSIVHFKQAFQRYLNENPSRQDDFPVLQLFMEQIDELQAVRFIPRILQLHKALLRRYNRKVYQEEALNITVYNLKKDKFADNDTEDLLKDLTDAWNIAKNGLKNHVFRTDKDSRTAIPEEISNMMITDETQLVYLLPTMDGKGICTFALLDYLVRCQNRLIEKYKESLRKELAEAFTDVSPRDITAAHVVSFQPQNDLLPIILSNCSMRTNFIVEDNYDFEAVEKQVIDRFISTKSAINGGRRLQIDLMTYRSELTDASEIEMLHRKIPQERLEVSVQSAICNGLVDVPIISQMLSTLDVAINFLNITGGNPDDSLHEYIVGRLKIREGVLTAKMQQECQLKHVKSLWVTLSFHKSYIMVQQNKPVEIIFENIAQEYHEVLPQDISQKCETYAERLSKERLSQFLELLFEFITIELTKKQTQNDEDFVLMSQYRMKDSLVAFADIASLPVDFSDIPDNILCAHSLHTWTVSSRIYHRRYEEETEL